MKNKPVKVVRPTTVPGFGGGELRVQPKVWKACLAAELAMNEWAVKVKYDNTWLASASQMSLKSLYETISIPVLERTIRRYTYWYVRAHGRQGHYYIDPSMRRDWEAAGGKLDGDREVGK